MKSIYENLMARMNRYINDYSKRLSLLMILFFILFGTISLYFLLNTQG